MKTVPIFFLALALAAGSIFAADEGASNARPKPRMFSEISPAIQYAKSNNQLILFALLDTRVDASQAVLRMLNDNTLSLEQKEFVVVTCDASNPTNTSLFTTRFQQDTRKAPVVVVANSTGEMLGAQAGQSAFNDYIKVIHASLIKAGFRESGEKPMLLAADKGGDELVSGSSKIFRLTMEDVEMKNVLLSDYREWTLKNGEKFTAAVVKGEGSTGLFRMEDGKERNVSFNDFTAEDIEFLKTVLTAKPAEEDE